MTPQAPGPRPELAAILDEAERAAMETDEATSRESLVSDLLAYIDRREAEHTAALAASQAQVAEAERRGIEKGVEMAIEAASEHLGHEGENCPPHIVDEIRALLTEVPHD